MLLKQIKSDLIKAQKERDQEKVDTLRFLVGDITNFRIAKYPDKTEDDLTDEEVVTILKKQVKTHKESIEMFQTGGRDDLVEREKAQLAVLEGYLPGQMTEEDLRREIEKVRADHKGLDFGGMMKVCLAEFGSKTDGKSVSKILREMIES